MRHMRFFLKIYFKMLMLELNPTILTQTSSFYYMEHEIVFHYRLWSISLPLYIYNYVQHGDVSLVLRPRWLVSWRKPSFYTHEDW